MNSLFPSCLSSHSHCKFICVEFLAVEAGMVCVVKGHMNITSVTTTVHSITSYNTSLYGSSSDTSLGLMEAAGGRTDECVCLMFGFSWVKLSQGALRDPLQHLFGEDPHELPSDVQSLKHTPVLVGTWTHKHIMRGCCSYFQGQDKDLILTRGPVVRVTPVLWLIIK